MDSNKRQKKAPEPGPEQPEDESMMGVQYISFEDLRALTEEEAKNLESFT